MQNDIASIVSLLRGSSSSGAIAAETLKDIANEENLANIFHIIIIDTLYDKTWQARLNASLALKLLSNKFSELIYKELIAGGSDGDLLLLSDIRVAEVLRNGVKLRKSNLNHISEIDESNLYTKKWVKLQRNRLLKLIGFESSSSDVYLASKYQKSDTIELLDSDDFLVSKVNNEAPTDRIEPSGDVKDVKLSNHEVFFENKSNEPWIVRIVRKLTIDLMSPDWETRHGSSLGLISIIQSLHCRHEIDPAESEYKFEVNNFLNEFSKLPKFLLQDITSTSLCVLLLDHFYDFQNVYSNYSPVKDAAAKLLVLSSYQQGLDTSHLVLTKILELCQYEESNEESWSVKVSGLLALKYFIPLYFKLEINSFSGHTTTTTTTATTSCIKNHKNHIFHRHMPELLNLLSIVVSSLRSSEWEVSSSACSVIKSIETTMMMTMTMTTVIVSQYSDAYSEGSTYSHGLDLDLQTTWNSQVNNCVDSLSDLLIKIADEDRDCVNFNETNVNNVFQFVNNKTAGNLQKIPIKSLNIFEGLCSSIPLLFLAKNNYNLQYIWDACHKFLKFIELVLPIISLTDDPVFCLDQSLMIFTQLNKEILSIQGNNSLIDTEGESTSHLRMLQTKSIGLILSIFSSQRNLAQLHFKENDQFIINLIEKLSQFISNGWFEFNYQLFRIPHLMKKQNSSDVFLLKTVLNIIRKFIQLNNYENKEIFSEIEFLWDEELNSKYLSLRSNQVNYIVLPHVSSVFLECLFRAHLECPDSISVQSCQEYIVEITELFYSNIDLYLKELIKNNHHHLSEPKKQKKIKIVFNNSITLSKDDNLQSPEETLRIDILEILIICYIHLYEKISTFHNSLPNSSAFKSILDLAKVGLMNLNNRLIDFFNEYMKINDFSIRNKIYTNKISNNKRIRGLLFLANYINHLNDDNPIQILSLFEKDHVANVTKLSASKISSLCLSFKDHLTICLKGLANELSVQLYILLVKLVKSILPLEKLCNLVSISKSDLLIDTIHTIILKLNKNILNDLLESGIVSIILNRLIIEFKQFVYREDPEYSNYISKVFLIFKQIILNCESNRVLSQILTFYYESIHKMKDDIKNVSNHPRRRYFKFLSYLINESCELVLPSYRHFLDLCMSILNDVDIGVRKYAATIFRNMVSFAPLVRNQRDAAHNHTIQDIPTIDKSINNLSEYLITSVQFPKLFPTTESESEENSTQKYSDLYMLPTIKTQTKFLEFSSPLSLRQYQWLGATWLTHLRRCRLGGILCDEMGTGKTVQAIAALAILRLETTTTKNTRPILIVCPASLTLHWENEIRKFIIDENLLKPVLYNSKQDINLTNYSDFNQGNLAIIVSYTILSRDIEFFSSIFWEAVVLDEIHMIKNPSTKNASAAYSLKSHVRMGLSGTPIQNEVEDIWSIFNFVIPGFLGELDQFNEEFVKPIKMSMVLKSSSSSSSGKKSSSSREGEGEVNELSFQDSVKDHQIELSAVGVDKLRVLHKRILPFILRRLKSEVLAELPSKTIIDISCPLSSIQKEMYVHFQKGLKISDETLETELKLVLSSYHTNQLEKARHALQAFTYLKLLCIHPSLVVSDEHPAYKTSLLKNIGSSGKMLALLKLLEDASIVSKSDRAKISDLSNSNNQNDLISEYFSQLSSSDQNLFNNESFASDSDDSDDIDSESSSCSNTEESYDEIRTYKKIKLESDHCEEPPIFKDKNKGKDLKPQIKQPRKILGNNNIKSGLNNINNINNNLFTCVTNDSNTFEVNDSETKVKKCLIYAQHRKVLDLIETYILQKFYPYIAYDRLDGSTPPLTRAKKVEQFNNTHGPGPESSRILLMTTRACGLGLNLSTADTVIFIENDWNPFIDNQAMDRVHRIGQTKPVTIYRILAESTIEARIIGIQAFKENMVTKVINSENSGSKYFSSEDEASGKSLGNMLCDSLFDSYSKSMININSNAIKDFDYLDENENLNLESFIKEFG